MLCPLCPSSEVVGVDSSQNNPSQKVMACGKVTISFSWGKKAQRDFFFFLKEEVEEGKEAAGKKSVVF